MRRGEGEADVLSRTVGVGRWMAVEMTVAGGTRARGLSGHWLTTHPPGPVRVRLIPMLESMHQFTRYAITYTHAGQMVGWPGGQGVHQAAYEGGGRVYAMCMLWSGVVMLHKKLLHEVVTTRRRQSWGTYAAQWLWLWSWLWSWSSLWWWPWWSIM